MTIEAGSHGDEQFPASAVALILNFESAVEPVAPLTSASAVNAARTQSTNTSRRPTGGTISKCRTKQQRSRPRKQALRRRIRLTGNETAGLGPAVSPNRNLVTGFR